MKELNADAKYLLLQLIEANGGSIHRGALHKALENLLTEELVTVDFATQQPRTLADHANYSFNLAPRSRKVLESLRKKRFQDMGVKIIREKHGNITIIEWNADTYRLQHPDTNYRGQHNRKGRTKHANSDAGTAKSQ